VQTAAGGSNRNGSIFFSTGGSRYGAGGLPTGAPEEYHQRNSTFLFADGHVKTLRPTLTWPAAVDALVLQFNAAYVNAQPGAPRSGAGQVNMWCPGSLYATCP
jgi:prepilin-type processing-associated H-X9-DG protein